MSRICVYLGSRAGNSPVFQQAATQLGALLAERGHTLVYGGARIGLMGELANATLSAGGKAIGVMPDHLVEREQAHHGLTELIRVRDMHERKATMAAQADGFIALPGGIGTLEELFEIWTWGYLGLHDKPVGLLNINVTELIRVRDMHERKATMAAQADGFIALPGGIGTLEELFEIWTWGYLGLHDKPVGLLNINDFYTPLLSFLDNTVDQGFLVTTTREMLLDAETPLTILEAIEAQL